MTTIARLERPLLIAGLALVMAHLLDLSLSGATRLPGLLAIVAVAARWAASQPHVTRPTRVALALAIGLLSSASASRRMACTWSTPVPTARRHRSRHVIGGLCCRGRGRRRSRPRGVRGAPLRPRQATGARGHPDCRRRGHRVIAVVPFAVTQLTTHAPRWPIADSTLGIAHQDVRDRTADGRGLTAWYVPVAQRRRGARHPRLGRQPGAGRRARPDARASRLRRARTRPPRQRRERGTFQRAGYRPGCRRRPRLARPPTRRPPAAIAASASRWAARSCSRRRHATAARRRLRRRRTPDGRRQGRSSARTRARPRRRG